MLNPAVVVLDNPVQEFMGSATLIEVRENCDYTETRCGANNTFVFWNMTKYSTSKYVKYIRVDTE